MDTRLPAYYAALCYLKERGVLNMAYAYGMRFDDNSNAITVIDEDNQTAVTTGYIDGEYVEFGGGGSSDFSKATISFDGNEGISVHLTGPFIYDGMIELTADVEVGDGPYNIVLAPSGTEVWIECSYGTFTVSGDIQHVGGISSPAYNVTGDCTITIS